MKRLLLTAWRDKAIESCGYELDATEDSWTLTLWHGLPGCALVIGWSKFGWYVPGMPKPDEGVQLLHDLQAMTGPGDQGREFADEWDRLG